MTSEPLDDMAVNFDIQDPVVTQLVGGIDSPGSPPSIFMTDYSYPNSISGMAHQATLDVLDGLNKVYGTSVQPL
jgi:hypothetical protein